MSNPVGRPRSEAADFERFSLRIPAELAAWVRECAEAEERPLNTELICMLKYLRRHKPAGPFREQRRAPSLV